MMKAVAKRQDKDLKGEVPVEEEVEDDAEPDEMFIKARYLMVRTYEIAVRRWGDTNTLPFVHTLLAFIWNVSQEPKAIQHLEKDFPWQLTATMLNYLYKSSGPATRIASKEFPGALKNELPRPLPEDFAMRGLVYTEDYYPESWFKDCALEEDEKLIELASMTEARTERVLWLGRRIAESGKWLQWNEESRNFNVAEGFAISSDDSYLTSNVPSVTG